MKSIHLLQTLAWFLKVSDFFISFFLLYDMILMIQRTEWAQVGLYQIYEE